eukprot:2978850-Rhodomonas_salina.1
MIDRQRRNGEAGGNRSVRGRERRMERTREMQTEREAREKAERIFSLSNVSLPREEPHAHKTGSDPTSSLSHFYGPRALRWSDHKDSDPPQKINDQLQEIILSVTEALCEGKGTDVSSTQYQEMVYLFITESYVV